MCNLTERLLTTKVLAFELHCSVRGSIELRRRKKKPEEMKRDEKGKMGSKSFPVPLPAFLLFLPVFVAAQLSSHLWLTFQTSL